MTPDCRRPGVPNPARTTLRTSPSGPGTGSAAAAEERLPPLFAGLDLELVIGGLLLFGPRRAGYVLVRQVMVSTGLARLQQRVVEVCGSGYGGQFRDGRWSPHITLARRVAPTRWARRSGLSPAAPAELTATVRRARRWDGDRKVAWSLTSA